MVYQALEHVEWHDADDDETLRRLGRNHPDIIHLSVRLRDDTEDYVGHQIGKSRHLRTLCITDARGDDWDFDPIFFGIAKNRSIERLSVDGFNHSTMDIFRVLAPFFAHNHNLRSIEFCGIMLIEGNEHHLPFLISPRIPSFISALLHSKDNKLEQIILSHNTIEDEQARDIFNALRDMSGLNHLLDLNFESNRMGKEGCTALGGLMKHPLFKVQRLDLSRNNLDNECMRILFDALAKNNTIEWLNLSRLKLVTPSGWSSFLTVFSSSLCCVKQLILSMNDIGDDGATSLGNSLAVNTTVTKISLLNEKSITAVGWRGFAKCLTSPEFAIEMLHLCNCGIDDLGAKTIARALAENTSIMDFNISGNSNVTPAGWIECFNYLRTCKAPLSELNLSDNDIDDVAAAEFVASLARMSTLVSLNLSGLLSISDDGLSVFADVLKPTFGSKLQQLKLGSMHGNDEVIPCFAEALRNNSNVISLQFLGFQVSETGLNALVNALCDKSSITSTFSSNHTLRECLVFPRTLTAVENKLKMMLFMNEDTNKADVARSKILDYHLTDNNASIDGVFGHMAAPIIPTALSWIGRDRNEYSMMVHLLQCMPWLLESAAKSNTQD